MENYTLENSPGNGTDLLEQEASAYFQFEYASTGQRFLNFLIDQLFMRYVLTYASGFMVGYLLVLISPDLFQNALEETTTGILILAGLIVAIINHLVYYTFCEKLFRGYTLGKIITGTRAIREDGGELTLRNAFLRSLSRLVPFEAFSGFSIRPWHDQWTDTMVVKSR
jgi:uncharacterized RDD family membrane protein YckC